MKQSWIILIGAAVLLSAVLFTGCGKKAGVTLGAMPSAAEMPDPGDQQMVTDMRAWVESLAPEDAKALNDAGKLNLTWQQIQTSYPTQASQIDNYVEARRLARIAIYQQKGRPISEQQAVHHAPDTVDIEKTSSGQCRLLISSTAGSTIYLQIAK